MTTPSSAHGNSGGNERLRQGVPSRAEVDSGRVRLLKTGGFTKAELWLVDVRGQSLVVKDFRDKGWWGRLLGRLLIAREYRAYRWLGDLPGLPRLLGRIDAHALALEFIEGVELSRSPAHLEDGERSLASLRRTVQHLHAAGLAHLDLRRRENVLLGSDGEVYVLDLAGAVWLRPGGLAHRLFFGWLRVPDETALLKWKRVLDAGPYDAEEKAFLLRYRFWRSMWILNPKGRGRKIGKD